MGFPEGPALDPADGPDATDPDQEPVDMNDEPESAGSGSDAMLHERLLGIANSAAASATQAWLTGRGLAVELEESRLDQEPIPAPGFDELLEELGVRCGDACNAADATFSIINGTAPEVDFEAAIASTSRANDAVMLTQACLRRLAVLTLGVTSQCDGTDAIYRLERAATMVLHPFGENGIEAVDDGMTFRARYPAELVTELAGLLSRMIVDHDCSAVLRVGDGAGAVTFSVDHVGYLAAVASGVPIAPEDADVRDELGWNEERRLVAAWPDPATVIQPARAGIYVLEHLMGLGAPSDLVCTITRRDSSFE